MLAGAIAGQARSAGSDASAKVGVSPVESLGSEVGGWVRCDCWEDGGGN
jgi:hypothetical protein